MAELSAPGGSSPAAPAAPAADAPVVHLARLPPQLFALIVQSCVRQERAALHACCKAIASLQVWSELVSRRWTACFAPAQRSQCYLPELEAW